MELEVELDLELELELQVEFELELDLVLDAELDEDHLLLLFDLTPLINSKELEELDLEEELAAALA